MESSSSSSFYNIEYYKDIIFTTVTASAKDVDEWIAATLRINRRKLCKLLVGLDTEWKLASNPGDHQPVAIIQLCVGRRCLIFQLYHADHIPYSLVNFLGGEKFTFVGKAVKNDAYKLMEDYGLRVAKVKDVSSMAAKKYNDKDLKRTGLRMLVMEFLGTWMHKPKHITMSQWHNFELSYPQIQYAAIDAFVSYRLAEELSKPRVYVA